MLLPEILVLTACFLLLRLVKPRQMRMRILTVLTVWGVFKLQSSVPIRNFDFWFPLLSIILTLSCWTAVRDPSQAPEREDRIGFILIAAGSAAAACTRLFSLNGILTASRPPQLTLSLSAGLAGAALIFLSGLLSRKRQKALLAFWISLILAFLIVLKLPAAGKAAAAFLRQISSQSTDTAAAGDLRWLGFSYIAFRLLSILIDTRKGKVCAYPLEEFWIYVCFPPALPAGPIDRPERFLKDICEEKNEPGQIGEDWNAALLKISSGLFKKFILADSLAKFSLSAQNSAQVLSSGWAWLVLSAYGLRIYFDFSGYSDIAIGIARLLGLKLPENFNHPYLKPDIAKFWSSWHITLTQWIRSYVFNPLTRSMKKAKRYPEWLIILTTQLVTMLLIGAWHGITLNFLIWGAWHGLGLFIHQEYGRHSAKFLRSLEKEHPLLKKVYTVCGTLLTILFVLIGWVWFVLPDFGQAAAFLGKLF